MTLKKRFVRNKAQKTPFCSKQDPIKTVSLKTKQERQIIMNPLLLFTQSQTNKVNVNTRNQMIKQLI